MIYYSYSVSSRIDLAYNSFLAFTLCTEWEVRERSYFIRDTLSAAYFDVY